MPAPNVIPIPRPPKPVPKPAPSPDDYADLVGIYVEDTTRLKRAVTVVGVVGSLVGVVVGMVIARREENEK
jgi:hypothetical protein